MSISAIFGGRLVVFIIAKVARFIRSIRIVKISIRAACGNSSTPCNTAIRGSRPGRGSVAAGARGRPGRISAGHKHPCTAPSIHEVGEIKRDWT